MRIPIQPTRKQCHIIILVDTSDNMRFNGRIGAVYQTFTSMLPALHENQFNDQSEFKLNISIVRFNETNEFIIEPTPILEYNHNEIQSSQCVTYYSRAFELLSEKSHGEHTWHMKEKLQSSLL